MTKVGVIGVGVVGGAVVEGLAPYMDVETYDPRVPSTCGSVAEVCAKAGVIFVCVPTPTSSAGYGANLSHVFDVAEEIAAVAQDHVVAIKSTVPPGTTAKLRRTYGSKRLDFVFQPEFLTEANAREDFRKQDRIVIGGGGVSALRVEQVFARAFPGVPVYHTSETAAELVKYTANCFLMTKVLFANEMAEICSAAGVSWDTVTKLAQLDARLGASHWRVPGPDGLPGAGGACFPKDIKALIHTARALGVAPEILLSVLEKNERIRPAP
jgi:UDPglucose 6-dehydrogenase